MNLREITAEVITKTVRKLCIEANTILGDDMIEAYKQGIEKETSPVGKDVFRQLLENAKIAKGRKPCSVSRYRDGNSIHRTWSGCPCRGRKPKRSDYRGGKARL